MEIKRRRRRRKCCKMDWLSRESIRPYLNMDQQTAASTLQVSISTLKRRFYSLNMGRWPDNRNPNQSEKVQKLRIWITKNTNKPTCGIPVSHLLNTNKPTCGIPVSHLLNITIKNEKDIDENTWYYLATATATTTASLVNKTSI